MRWRPLRRRPLRLVGEIAAAEKRLHYVSALGRFGVHVWGDDGWSCIQAPGVRYRGGAGHIHELNKIYCASDINVDIGRLYQSDIATMRVFDILACGGFVLAERSPALADLFRIGDEIETYSTLDELLHKVAYYPDDPDARRRIAQRGMDRVRRDHTIDRRLHYMLAKIGEHASPDLRSLSVHSSDRSGLAVEELFEVALQHHRSGRVAEAEALYRRVLSARPHSTAAHSNLAYSLQDQGKLEEAEIHYRQAVALEPVRPELHTNLGTALNDLGKLDEAIVSYRRALALDPDCVEACSNLGNSLTRQLKLGEAIASYERALALSPNHTDAHFNLSVALLLQGHFGRGWREHEWRWRGSQFRNIERNFPQPQWDGSPLEGKTILLHAEQGFGDAIQFVRYAPLVAARGGQIVLECQPQLQRLFQDIHSAGQVIARGDPLPAFDVHAPLMSLPYLFATRLDTIPAGVPYLQPDSDLVAAWRARLAGIHEIKIGLVWAGSPIHKNDANRSLPLAALAPLGAIPGVRFYSLQKGTGAAQMRTPPAGISVVDLAPLLGDFADTAAAVAALDLVITVDTSVAHLAGALGRPVWLLLPYVPDWRWLLDRSDSPWYPSMRLFRQPFAGDWPGVVNQVGAALGALTTAHQR